MSSLKTKCHSKIEKRIEKFNTRNQIYKENQFPRHFNKETKYISTVLYGHGCAEEILSSETE